MPRSWAAPSASAIWRAIGQRLVERQRALGDALGEGRPLDQLEDQHRRAARVLQAIDRPDVRVIEGRQHLRLPPEARQALGIRAVELGQDLQRDVAVELGVARPIDLAHAARAEGRLDLVGAEAGAGGEGHLAAEHGIDRRWHTCRTSIQLERAAMEPIRDAESPSPEERGASWASAVTKLFGSPLAAVSILALLLFRLHLCLDAPLESTGVLRNLGYASHLWERGFSIYDAVAREFAPEVWTDLFPDLRYTYPPVALVFFALLATLGLGIFHAKLVLTLIELAIALTFARVVSPAAGVAYFAMPVSVWFVSHEGQFEPLMVGLLCVAILLLQKGRWLAGSLTWGLAMQAKQFAVFLAPWVVWIVWSAAKRKTALRKSLLGLALSSLPFLGFYIVSPSIPVEALLQSHGLGWSYNPFAWNFTDAERFDWNPAWLVAWNAVTSYLLLALPLIALSRGKSKSEALAAYSPWILGWTLIKSLNVAEFLVCAGHSGADALLQEQAPNRRIAPLAHDVQCGRSLAQLTGHHFGYTEWVRSSRGHD